MPTRLIIDCDTGSDDAVAIMAAALHPELDLIAVTTVNGNVPLENTTDNSLRVLDHIGSEVPVFAGAPRPLVRPDFPIPRAVLNARNPEFQKLSLDFPDARSSVRPGNAVQFLIDTYLDDSNLDVVLVAVGPLTNVALALAAEPSLAARIPKLVIMGGSIGWGNVTAAAEFNFWVDPEAAEAVLSAGIREVVILPLDATHDAPLSLADCDRLDAIGTPAATGTSMLVRHRIGHYPDAPDAEKLTAPVHDALCVAYLVHPEVLTEVGEYAVHVETQGERTLGAMLADDRGWSTDIRNACVARRADEHVFMRFLTDAFSP
jgi:inosine-uridine nucleoside N-ribohydrolase